MTHSGDTPVRQCSKSLRLKLEGDTPRSQGGSGRYFSGFP
ncbi:hypothetical protein CBM2609_A110011 [Cupriavidus taiwanensis]|nr:hypothetical protein CBM2604_A90010 [Cupriavidus taiwanensis]SOZ23406.1 hypothetical protein CBM2609_A110011 [Cupriavidus taiwanensis]SOZ43823.1 hypothetical protein CBM2610_A110011 [Cupriavidus taiwanensis]